MSRENVEIVRRCFDVLNRERLDVVLNEIDVACDPAIEIRQGAGRLPDLNRFRGREAVKAWFAAILGTLDTHFETDEFIDAGDSVVVLFRQISRGRASGVELTNPFAAVYELRDGKIIYMDIFRTRAEALAAVGLRE
jgi:ketosteroid isomerase-like protein